MMTKGPLPRTLWIALRFIVFGLFGFVVMLSSFVALVDRLTSIHHETGYLIPLGLIAVCSLGAVMMLFGVGEWGRWGYLFVFLTIPISLLLLFLFPHAGKGVGVLVPSLALVGTYITVRAYYARRKRKELSQHA
jgi:hypothetical protein